jgi:hypothetical protein
MLAGLALAGGAVVRGVAVCGRQCAVVVVAWPSVATLEDLVELLWGVRGQGADVRVWRRI